MPLAQDEELLDTWSGVGGCVRPGGGGWGAEGDTPCTGARKVQNQTNLTDTLFTAISHWLIND
jgi:hypothetical protein